MAITLKGINKANVAKNLAKNYKYVTHLDRAIDEEEFEWTAEFKPKLPDDAWHPSGDCTPSLHELWLKAIGRQTRRPFSVGLLKTFMVGHFWHAYLQHITVERLGFAGPEAVERRGHTWWGPVEKTDKAEAFTGRVALPEFAPNLPSDETSLFKPLPYHWATGSGDIAPAELPGHGEFLIDFKTMNGNDFRKPDPPEWSAHKWECQLNIYMDWFDLERGLLVGVQKDNPHEFKEWEYRRNQPLIDAIYLKWKLVSECLDEDIDVPEEEDIDLPLRGPVST